MDDNFAEISVQFPHLFTPGEIGNMSLKNRIVMPAISTKYSKSDGEITQRYIDFCVERARGGVAFIIIENTCIEWPRGKGGTNPVRIDRDRFIPGLNELVEEVHMAGAKIATQLQHVGRQTNLIMTEGIQPIAPSAIPGFGQTDLPYEMTSEDINEIVKLFGEAARRTMQAGFDAVEIHGAHGYLITQFLSPALNKRRDEYGGSLDNRLRVPLSIVRQVRESVGPDYPIIFRYSVEEAIPGGLEIDEAKTIALKLQEAGVDALDVSSGIYESAYRIFPVMGMPKGCYAHLAEAIKAEVKIPVIAVGKINEPDIAEEILSQGRADFVAIGRQLLADPEFPNKAREGLIEDIRPCLSCNNGCFGRLPRQWRIKCDVNPELGNERVSRIHPARRKKRVLVVGGGPAGMQCAIDAAAGEHEVMLFERNSELGGLLNLACRPPGKEQIRRFRDYLVRQVRRSIVEVQVNSPVNESLVRQIRPDVVVIAAGARVDWAGIEREGDGILTVEKVLLGEEILGDDVLMVGGGRAGCETAEYLAVQGKKVTILERFDGVALDLDGATRMYLKMRLEKLGIKILTNTLALKISDHSVEILTDNGPRNLTADTVVLAVGYAPRQELLLQLRHEQAKVFAIGDCVKPRKIFDAIHEGAYLARELCR